MNGHTGDGSDGSGGNDPSEEFDLGTFITCAGYGTQSGSDFWDPDEVFDWSAISGTAAAVGAITSLYDLLDIDDEDSSGPIHERTTTVFEMERGHASVLQEFRLRPGRWLLWVELDNITCATCGESDGRYLQFAFLERAGGVIGECADNAMLDECCKYTSEQIDALHALGWIDPIEGTTPNLHRFATTDDEVAALAVLTMRTLCEVFELGPEARVRTMFQERILGERSA